MPPAQMNVKTQCGDFASRSEIYATMIPGFDWGAVLAISAAIRHCIVLFAFAAALVGGGALAGIDPAFEAGAASAELDSASEQAGQKTSARTPCKRPKARTHYGCDTCQQLVSITAVSRTRLFLPAPKLKLVVADTLGDRLALAAAQASALRVLAGEGSLRSGRPPGEIIARTARIRN